MNVFKRRFKIYYFIVFTFIFCFFNINNVDASSSYVYIPYQIRNQTDKVNYTPELYNYFYTNGNVQWSSPTSGSNVVEYYYHFNPSSGQEQITKGDIQFNVLLPQFYEKYAIASSVTETESGGYASQFFCTNYQNGTCLNWAASTERITKSNEYQYNDIHNGNSLYSNFVIIYLVINGQNYFCNLNQVNGSNSISATCPNVYLGNSGFSVIIIGRGFHGISRMGVSSATYTSDALVDISNNSSATNEKLDDIKKEQQETNKNIKDMNDTLKDDSIDNEKSSSFFDNFEDNDIGGISGIIIAPLNAIQNLTNASCSPLNLPVPFVNKNITLPCMSSIYENKFGTFYSIYRVIMFGLVSYFVCLRIFKMIHGFKDPNSDRIEVVDL